MTDTIRWGILGASNFALTDMAPAIHAARDCTLAAVASRTPEKAAPFATLAPGLTVHNDYDALLADPNIDAVYIPLPHPLHVPWGIKALEAGKHVLVEKPAAMSAPQIDPFIAARDRTGLVASEAFMIPHHPQWQLTRKLLADGAIGTLQHINATFTYNNASAPKNIRNNADTGGGSLPDIGVYTIGAARLVTGAEPRINHAAITWEGKCEVTTRATASFGDVTAHWLTSMRMDRWQQVTLHGSKGVIRLPCPFNPLGYDAARVILEAGERREETRFPSVNQYVLQVENVAAAIRGDASLLWTLEDAKATQSVIDAIHAAA